MPHGPRLVALCASLALALPLTGCGADAPAPPRASASHSLTPDVDITPDPQGSGTATSDQPDATYSLPAIAAAPPDAGDLVVTRDAGSTRQYVREEISYRSDGLTITGLLVRPRGEGPFPAVVIAHGRVSLEGYRTGDGLVMEQQALVAAGHVVLQTDYRGHAGSDPLGAFEQDTLVGYTRDAINALATLQEQEYVDPDRLALLGRSMGGGIAMNVLVTHPELVRAAVLVSPTSSSYSEARALLARLGRPADRDTITDEFGTPRANPAFYAHLSARTYFSRVNAPVLIQHGTADATCPVEWSETTLDALQSAGGDAALELYEGEGHIFEARRAQAIARAVAFLGERLG